MSGSGDATYAVSAEAQNDLFEIWQHIAEDSIELANRIEREFYDTFASLARFPYRAICART
jgi:plasmid stabilization system protein ParE